MDKKQHIAIFTTTNLPWMTGTAANPLFRAAYLSKNGERKVTLVIPWLSLKDQEMVYPNSITFISSIEQEKYVHYIRFYPGRHHLVVQFSQDKRSVFAIGDISEVIPDEDADIVVKFRMVIGIIHTKYLEYVKREKNGRMQAFLLKVINSWVVIIYCHKVIRLSAATQDYPKSIICNVHGVNPKFLGIDKQKIEQLQNEKQTFTKGAYYIGKMVWSKGYKELLKLLHDHQMELVGLEVDLYGSGEDSDQVQEAAKRLEVSVTVHPGCDHADPLFHDYKVFLNPSTTYMVCTTTTKALAMGKIVTYDDNNGFVEATRKALTTEPVQLTDSQRHELSWKAATKWFLKVSELDQVSTTKLSNIAAKNFMSTSFNFQRNMEDASAFVHFLTSGSLQPNEQHCKELGLAIPT
ncbi:hypothetical protein I3842_02G027600 [Carya illinoinensis]|uniref:Digalactosyldiacylglycerol synthase n=1 Tax=Carya illinoinensis TaxID=32201 RepID=A0A922FN05_CARIL|nr:hypothetical protein I3842_02G027600 [Carya illinoinensis]